MRELPFEWNPWSGCTRPELKRDYRVEPIRKVALAVAVPDDHRLAQEIADGTYY